MLPLTYWPYIMPVIFFENASWNQDIGPQGVLRPGRPM